MTRVVVAFAAEQRRAERRAGSRDAREKPPARSVLSEQTETIARRVGAGPSADLRRQLEGKTRPAIRSCRRPAIQRIPHHAGLRRVVVTPLGMPCASIAANGLWQ
jgi:hypothetical protein